MVKMNLDMPEKKFLCKCCGLGEMNKKFLDRLATIQFGMQEELVITSGFRCPHHNKEVGGSPTSKHLLGLAADVACTDSHKRHLLVSLAVRNGIRGIGIAKGFVHLDQREGPTVLWTYPITENID